MPAPLLISSLMLGSGAHIDKVSQAKPCWELCSTQWSVSLIQHVGLLALLSQGRVWMRSNSHR